MLPALSN